jgi:hypothetical protein
MYERMKPLEKLNPKTEFSYWIKNFIVSRIRALRFGDILDGIEAGKYPESYEEVISALSEI